MRTPGSGHGTRAFPRRVPTQCTSKLSRKLENGIRIRCTQQCLNVLIHLRPNLVDRIQFGTAFVGQPDHVAAALRGVGGTAESRGRPQGGPNNGVEESDWRYLLMNWGYNPMKEG